MSWPGYESDLPETTARGKSRGKKTLDYSVLIFKKKKRKHISTVVDPMGETQKNKTGAIIWYPWK